MAQMANGNGLELIGQFIVPESWENDTKGNPKYIYENYFLPMISPLNEPASVYYAEVVGNTSAIYRLERLLFFGGVYESSIGSVLRYQNGYQFRVFSESISTWCSAGSVIKVYKVVQ